MNRTARPLGAIALMQGGEQDILGDAGLRMPPEDVAAKVRNELAHAHLGEGWHKAVSTNARIALVGQDA